ncbi:hypothetical protein AO825_07795 [Pectobacterium brasiliense]|nr:hypothetical protein KS44_14830 [Pectobacterium brasiliense]KRF64249.1 hypothetical protein AO825_07795 [Pectobacterium brasiliense]
MECTSQSLCIKFSGGTIHIKHQDLPPQNKTRYHRGGYSLLHLLIFIFAEFFQREFLCLFSTSHAIPSQTS